jgi:hypothetical protein
MFRGLLAPPASGSVAPASSADGRTFTRAAATGTVATVLKNGASIATFTAAAGLLSYTFATPQLLTDQIAFLATATDAKAGVAATLAAGTPVVSGTTFDPAGASGTLVLSSGNRTVTSTGSANAVRTLGNFATGKYYIEFTALNVGSGWQVAIVAAGQSLTNGGNGFAGFDTAVTIRWDGAVYKGSSFSNPMSIGAIANGDVIGIAVNRTNGVYFVRKNGGTWYGNGGTGKDPTVAGQGDPLPTGLTGAAVYFAAMPGGSGQAVTMNPTPASVPTGYATLSSSVAPTIPVFIFAGQSNATGTGQGPNIDDGSQVSWAADPLIQAWDGGKFVDYAPGLRTGWGYGVWDTAGNAGPEIGFLTAWRAANPGQPCVVLKVTARGTQLAQSADGTTTYDWSPSSAGELYPQAKAWISNALSALTALGYTPAVQAAVWTQGENDAGDATNASNYQTNLTNFITSVRADWGLGSTGLFIVSRLRPAFTNAGTIRTAQFNVAAANPGGPVSLIETSDIAVGADNTHYTIPGRTVLGQRAYASFMGAYTEPTN